MFKVILLKSFFLLSILSCVAQDSVVLRHAIKISPLHLINFYPTAQIGYEIYLKKDITIAAEYGYVLNYSNNNERFQNKRGWKTKLEPRWYFDYNEKSKESPYIALELYFNKVDFDREDRRQECFDLDCEHFYNRTYNYTIKYSEQGIGLKGGFLRYIDSKFFVEVNAGLAVRFIKYDKPNLVRSLNERDGFNWIKEESRRAYMPLLSARIDYRLK